MFIKKYSILGIVFSLFYSSFSLLAMKKEVVYGGIVVGGACYLNETLNNKSFKKNIVNNYKKEIFSQGKNQIDRLNDTIRTEMNESIYGFSYLPKIAFVNSKKPNKKLKQINKKLIKTTIEPIKQKIIDTAYDYAAVGIGSGAICVGIYQGLRKKSPFNIKKAINTVVKTSATGVITTCGITEAIEKNPESITRASLIIYDKCIEETFLKEISTLTHNGLQLTKEALKENQSWNDRFIIQRLIKQDSLKPTQFIILDEETTKKAIQEYHNELKEIIKNDVTHYGKTAVRTIANGIFVGSLFAIGVDPSLTNVTTSGLSLVTKSLCDDKPSSK